MRVLSHPDDSWRGERGFVQVVEALAFHGLLVCFLCLYNS